MRHDSGPLFRTPRADLFRFGFYSTSTTTLRRTAATSNIVKMFICCVRWQNSWYVVAFPHRRCCPVGQNDCSAERICLVRGKWWATFSGVAQQMGKVVEAATRPHQDAMSTRAGTRVHRPCPPSAVLRKEKGGEQGECHCCSPWKQ